LCRWAQTVCKTFSTRFERLEIWSTQSRLASKILAEFAALTDPEILGVSLNTIDPCSGLRQKKTQQGMRSEYDSSSGGSLLGASTYVLEQV
jgi:hypothetical protein